MADFLKRRLRKSAALRANRYFLAVYYGEWLRDHPPWVVAKLLFSRLAFASHLPLLLPERRFPLRHRGAKIYINPFDSPFTMDLALGVYEYWMNELFSRLLREGMTVFDVGAHHGAYAMLFAQRMGDRGVVHAFEPDPANRAWIQRNIEANGFRSIQVHPWALSDRDGKTTFHAAGGLGSLVFNPVAEKLKVDRREMAVATRTLDGFVAEHGIRHIDLIKIDVEGGDLMVLGGAVKSLSTLTDALLMDVDLWSNVDRAALFDLLRSCGFELYRIGKRLEPLTRAEQLFLFDDRGRLLDRKTRRFVRSIYATKIKGH